MITLPLRLRYSTVAVRPPAAWLVPGRDAREWLDELLGWDVPLTALTLFVVPRWHGDGASAGVLTIPDKGYLPTVSCRCQPYGRIGGQGSARPIPTGAIYVPVEARIEPDATDAELAAVLSSNGGVCLLHPAIGLVRFLESDAYRVADLLELTPAHDAEWDRAVPGVALSPRLLSIEPAVVPSVEMVLEGGRDDIASRRPSVRELPRSPDEPSGAVLDRVGRALKRQVARMAAWMVSGKSAPDRASSSGRLGQWARRQLAELDWAVLASRHREILRLMYLLETNPEKGLRYALPMGSGGHRGIAPPAGRLVHRDIDFNLERLGNAGPADPWELPVDFQTRLLTMYHGLAGRETQMGRHRRAAYIYAELLGNLELAANALKTGKHFREAAVLYRKRLGRADEAARCLEQGGLWTEAIALYVELEDFEKVGDLYSQLRQTDRARDAYVLAVVRHRERGDYLTAARILELKLLDCDEAIVCLEAGWPTSRQAGRCLEELFHVLGRHGRHEAARDKLAQLRRQTGSEQSVSIVEILSRVAMAYPHRPVQTVAADATRVIAALCLQRASLAESSTVLAAIRRLVPEDRLLGRDCNRFQQLRSLVSKSAPFVARRPSRPSGEMTLIRTIRLPGDVEWRNAASAGDAFYAVGYDGSRIEVLQGFWNGHVQGTEGAGWPRATPRHSPFLFACGNRGHSVLIRPLGGPALPWRWFQRTDESPFRIGVGTPPWLPDQAVAIGRTDSGESSMLVPGGAGLVLSNFDVHNELLGSQVLPWLDVWPDGNGCYQTPAYEPVPFLMRGDRAYLGLEDRLICWRPEGRVKVIDVGDRIVGMHCSAPFSRARVAVALREGAMLYWDDFQAVKSPFAEDLTAPVLRFVEGGWLAAISENACTVYRTAENCRVHREAVLHHEHGLPIAVLDTGQKDQFAVVTQEGTVAIYQIRKR